MTSINSRVLRRERCRRGQGLRSIVQREVSWAGRYKYLSLPLQARRFLSHMLLRRGFRLATHRLRAISAQGSRTAIPKICLPGLTDALDVSQTRQAAARQGPRRLLLRRLGLSLLPHRLRKSSMLSMVYRRRHRGIMENSQWSRAGNCSRAPPRARSLRLRRFLLQARR